MNELTDRIQKCPDGKYRWTYEVSLFKNFSIFEDLLKVMSLSVGIVYLIMVGVVFLKGFEWDDFFTVSKVFFFLMLFMWVLSLVGYLIWAAMEGGRYAALFEMDEVSVTHSMMKKHIKRKTLIGAIGALAGMAAGSPTLAGAQILGATVTSSTSNFKSVRRIIPVRRSDLIKVNGLFRKNRVWVENPEDYDFVLNYLREHCPRVR